MLVPPAQAAHRKRPNHTATLDITSNIAVFSKFESLHVTEAHHAKGRKVLAFAGFSPESEMLLHARAMEMLMKALMVAKVSIHLSRVPSVGDGGLEGSEGGAKTAIGQVCL
eukprot:2141361-Pleurochrysis_carterae.AAC.2